MKMGRLEILKKMIAVPKFLTYDLVGSGIEVKPGRFAPVYIDTKSIWAYPELVSQVANILRSVCKGSDCVVGIETGGSPYASLVSRDLKTSLILARKEAKKHLGILAGSINNRERKFAIIDDVLATGLSMERSLQSVRVPKRKIKAVFILSYGMDDIISNKYQIEVESIYSISDILDVLSDSMRQQLTPYIDDYKRKLKNIILCGG